MVGKHKVTPAVCIQDSDADSILQELLIGKGAGLGSYPLCTKKRKF